MSYAVMFPFVSSVTPGISFDPRLRGPTPERNSRFPTLRACGYEPTGSGAFSETYSLVSSMFLKEIDIENYLFSHLIKGGSALLNNGLDIIKNTKNWHKQVPVGSERMAYFVYEEEGYKKFTIDLILLGNGNSLFIINTYLHTLSKLSNLHLYSYDLKDETDLSFTKEYNTLLGKAQDILNKAKEGKKPKGTRLDDIFRSLGKCEDESEGEEKKQNGLRRKTLVIQFQTPGWRESFASRPAHFSKGSSLQRLPSTIRHRSRVLRSFHPAWCK